jgi:AAA15 family ATPase/GTPase
MIVEFSVKNFRSIKDLQTISFVATGLKSPDEFSEVDENNIAADGGMRLLKTIGIYGANASGKSNIIRALDYFLEAIRNEASSESNLGNLCDPFLYQESAMDTESFFQIVLIIENKKFRYGFTVKRNPKYALKGLTEKNSREIVTSEWLLGTKDKNMGEYFTRKGMEITKDKLPNNENIPPLQYEHTLFLTHAAAFDLLGIGNVFRSYIITTAIVNKNDNFRSLTIIRTDDNDDLLTFLSKFNLKYDNITIERDANTTDYPNISQDKIFLHKNFRNKNRDQIIKLNLGINESAGTQKLFDLAGLLLYAFHVQKLFITIDELDSNFHPSLLIKLIQLFNDPLVNKKNSQLLFTSHDTNLMSPSIMRRDQFYFAEKREDDSTRLYSLADLKGIRNDADFARDYLRGFYGAIPILGDYSPATTEENNGGLGTQR